MKFISYFSLLGVGQKYPTWSERGCNTVSIHFFDFNSILGLNPGLFDKRDILRHFYPIYRFRIASFMQNEKLAKY